MKFGVREICDVVLKAKAATKIGNKVFYKNEPVIYFDTLKTSSLEGAATTVYAQGGRGNARLVAWEGERTVTFTMEDALISPEGFMILSGAGLVEPTDAKPIFQHIIETTDAIVGDAQGGYTVYLKNQPYFPENGKENFIYVMGMKDGEPVTEPFIPEAAGALNPNGAGSEKWSGAAYEAEADGDYAGMYAITIKNHDDYVTEEDSDQYSVPDLAKLDVDAVLVDYYTPKTSNVQQIEITADKFGGNYYLEASTLFRDRNTGIDMPAEFIIPNCKIQSNFTFTMASSGDPSTFTFTMDAFPDYTRFDKTKKVLAAIQIINDASADELHRTQTDHDPEHEKVLG